MKIVYCIVGTFNSGGMERVLANKTNYLVKHGGHEVCIVTTDQQGRKPFFTFNACIKHYDLDVNYTETSNESLFIRLLAYYAKQRKHRQKLKNLLFELRADVVISMFDHDVSFLHKIRDDSQKVLEIHFSRFKRMQYGRKGLLGKIDKWRSDNDLSLARKYERFVVLTDEDKKYWGDLPNMVVIPNANTFNPTTSAKLVNKQAIAVGRFDYQKGFDDLIKLWKGVYREYPDWKLNIYGHGKLREEFLELINSLGLKQVVNLCPPTKDIERAYLDSSISLLTSRYEGLPMTLLEAQVCGLPMVAYACKCGPRDIIHEGQNGFLVEEGDQEGMVKRIIQLISDCELRKITGANAKTLSRRFSEEQVMNKWMELFKQLVVVKK